MTTPTTGVVDRIEDDTVLIVLEEGGQLEIERAAVPEAGRHEGAVFEIERAESEIERMEYQPEAEHDRRERAQDRFDRLSERLEEE